MKREHQKSLLDLEPEHGPSPRQELHWHLFYRQEFQRISDTFSSRHGQRPIFWSRSVRLDLDLFMTSPRKVMLVSLASGELLPPEDFTTHIWGLAPGDCTVERERHLSAQVVACLNSKLSPESWQPEIMEHISFVSEKKAQAMNLLQAHGLKAVMDRAWFKSIVRVFGHPELIRKVYKTGADNGCFR